MGLTPQNMHTNRMYANKMQRYIGMSRSFAGRLAMSLRRSLMEHIKKDGLANAVFVCGDASEKIIKNITKNPNHSIRRVSLKNRNPNNKPDPFEEKVLVRMAWALKNNRLKGEYFGVVQSGKDREFRWMKPIIVQKVCLQCHGDTKENISPEVLDKIKKHYKTDKATGYSAGELRGAISIKFKM